MLLFLLAIATREIPSLLGFRRSPSVADGIEEIDEKRVRAIVLVEFDLVFNDETVDSETVAGYHLDSRCDKS